MQRLKETQSCVLVYAHLVKAYTHTHTHGVFVATPALVFSSGAPC